MRRLSIALLIANVIAAVAYVYAAKPSWAIPEERAGGIHVVTGEPYLWASRALPILATFGLVNLIWGACLVARQRKLISLWLVTLVIWTSAVWIDFAHH